ncbi:MAG: CHASE2 domain-containing protein [Spirochaetales bacterium]|nr:CHASE2 domain-containing protein [Spirochaetales bacterium]
MKKKVSLNFLIPIIIAALFTLLNLFSFFQIGEQRIYDLLLHFKPEVPEEESILLIDIDDPAIAQVGVWPWSRDIMADGLILMKEFEANYAVFDIEYTEQSPLGVNADLLKEEIPDLFLEEFSSINRNVVDLFGAIQTGAISLRDAEDYVHDLSGLTDISKNILLDKVSEIVRDNDKYLGQAARLFGNTFFTINMLPDKDDVISDEHKSYVLKEISLKNVQVQDGNPFAALDIRPAILPIIQGAKGAGFPNVTVDGDGVMRRINLIMTYDNHYFPQLTLAPLLDWLGNPEVLIRKDRIVLRGAGIQGEQSKDISIPLTENGRMLINWPRKNFLDSFRHISYWELVLNKELEKRLIENLKAIDEVGYLYYYQDYIQGEFGLLSPYLYAEEIRKDVLSGDDPASMTDYREVRTYFFEEAGKYLSGTAEQEILSDIEAILESPEVSQEIKESYREIKGEVPTVFSSIREVYQSLMKSRDRLQENLTGSFCIIGQTGTSTTDIGVTPFEEEYMNVGIHAALINTILSGFFLDDLPWGYSAVLAIVLSLLVTLIIRRMDPLPSVIVGVIYIGIILSAIIGFFLLTGIYLNLLTPFLSVFFTTIVLFLLNFFVLEKEKSFLRHAFSHYLSTDVINELISDPEKLNLGGEKKYLTALFTDVRGFSTISEKLDPSDLVKLLNSYLTEMSNIILDLRGTIDKYEGDAIISFFGAPVEYQEHPEKACLAAVRMKKMERRLNEHFMKEEMSPTPLYTRIGINTGEMVVGNMGTPKKMDYTIMGNSVNLAARLEGVNKQYGTWILISEDTYKDAGADFTVRQLDRVRVVGIQKPVRLYELIDEKSCTEAKTMEALEMFHSALELFEQKEWAKAQKNFSTVLKIIPEDGPSNTYIQRCKDYKKKPPSDTWDGVFNLTIK